jgi:hypothetical protein
MSSSYVSFSTPALRKLTHLPNYTCTTSYVEVLAPRVLPERRVLVIIQNKSTSATLEIVLDSTGTDGLIVGPLGTLTVDNYNGPIRLKSTTAGSIAHIAYGSV